MKYDIVQSSLGNTWAFGFKNHIFKNFYSVFLISIPGDPSGGK